MQNLTLALTIDTYQSARVIAAEHNTSLSRIVQHYLSDLVAKRKAGEKITLIEPPKPQAAPHVAALMDLVKQPRPKYSAKSRLSRDDAHAR